jgi:hypothetical protein
MKMKLLRLMTLENNGIYLTVPLSDQYYVVGNLNPKTINNNITYETIPKSYLSWIDRYEIAKQNNQYNDILIYQGNINKNSQCQKWRLFVMEKLYGLSVKYTNIDSILQYQEYFQYNYWKKR